ncbi:hypothetical protein L208DRAFT_806525 [Tricholoma matsutake]|nr:hypothetical protein L208DRAFT_806525 [Tricholoma matsutake 945]
MIIISSDDEVGSRNPIWPIVTLLPDKRSAPCTPEVILVLDSDEEQDATPAMKGLRVKQEHGVQIKMEAGVDYRMDSHISMQCLHQPPGDSFERSGSL